MYNLFNCFEIEGDYRITSLSGRDIFDIDNCIQGFRHSAYRLELLRDSEEDEWKKKTIRELSESMYRLAENLKDVSVNIKKNKLSNDKD
jgi:hypothetical protein